MKKVFIVGAAGGVGKHLVRKLAALDIVPIGICRQEQQAQMLKALGGVPIVSDLQDETASSLASAMKGCDAVVFSAGAGGKGGKAMIDVIDRTAALNAIKATHLADIKKFIMVSSFPASPEDVPEFSEDFRYYFVAKRAVDEHLATTNLDWLILRPGWLTDGPATGQVSAGQAITKGAIPRADVAEFIVQALSSDHCHLVVELTQGETPIAEAIANLPGTSL